MHSTFRFTLFSLLFASICLVSCREKTKEENMKQGDKRFYTTECHISAFSIDGKDMMDSVRKYKLNGRFQFACGFRNRNEVDDRYITSTDIPAISPPNYPYDTLSGCRLNGSWNLQPNSARFNKMFLSVYLYCQGTQPIDYSTLIATQSDLFQNDNYWDVVADDGNEICLSLQKDGKSYFKKITAI